MSNQSLQYILSKPLNKGDVSGFYYDFQDSGIEDTIDATGGYIDWTGYFSNQHPLFEDYSYPAIAPYPAIALSATGFPFTPQLAKEKALSFIDGNGLQLSSTNLKIEKNTTNFDGFSMILGFEFSGEVSNGILFGSFEKEEIQLPNNSYETGSKGFNLGVTDRGHLFVQGYSKKGQFAEIINKELTKKNYIGIGISRGNINVSIFDFFENKHFVKSINLGKEYISCPEYFYFGGSEQYYASENTHQTTFNGYINRILGLNEYLTTQDLFEATKGMVGDYTFVSGGSGSNTEQRVTGETITYKTGIIGYETIVTGTGEVLTGVPYITGQYSVTGSKNVVEGQKYESNLYTGNKYISEVGYLDPSLRGSYSPTGEDANSILGLTDTGSSVSEYNLNTGTFYQYTGVELYGESPITGTLGEVSGVEYSYGINTTYYSIPDSSGVTFNINANNLKHDYIYYMGQR
jgi:hypothetical protein